MRFAYGGGVDEQHARSAAVRSHQIARGLAALVVTAVEVGHDENEARRQVGAFLRHLPAAMPGLLEEAAVVVAELAPDEAPRSDGTGQLLTIFEARSWLQRMARDSAAGAPL